MVDHSEKHHQQVHTAVGTVEDWKVLHQLSTTLLQPGALDSKLLQVLQSASDFHRAQSAVLSLYDPVAGALYVRASVGMAPQTLAGLNGIKPGEGACGRAVLSGQRYIAEEFEKDACLQPYLSWAREHCIGAVYASPFFNARHEAVGALSLYFDHIHRPSEREMQLADMCAGTIALFLDREEALATLTRSESRYRALTQTLSAIVWRFVPGEPGFQDISGWGNFTGQTAEESAGPGWFNAVHPDDRDATRLRWEAAMEAETGYECFFRLAHRDGSFRQIRTVAVPVRDDGGRVHEWIGSCDDITIEMQAREALKTEHRQKDEFLAVLSHELRNPLSAAMLAAQLLDTPGLPDGRPAQLGQLISRQIGHMSRLVEDLVDVARVSQGLVELAADRVDMSEVAQMALEQINPMLHARRHALVLALPESACLVTGDRVRLVQAVANLIGNAVRYTPEGGRISIQLAAQDDEVELSVSDNGIGLEPDIMPTLFDRFVQARRSSDRNAGGLGLGLALVKSIVELHSGTVTAASEGKNLGSVFTLRLPARR
ncbi:MAG: ATP-binding protein [Noviherbaspirillum sp.]